MLQGPNGGLDGSKAGRRASMVGKMGRAFAAGRMFKVDLKFAGVQYQDASKRHADFHALRHSFVTNLLRADVPLHVVASLAGHRDVSTTMRYAAIAVDPLAGLLFA